MLRPDARRPNSQVPSLCRPDRVPAQPYFADRGNAAVPPHVAPPYAQVCNPARRAPTSTLTPRHARRGQRPKSKPTQTLPLFLPRQHSRSQLIRDRTSSRARAMFCLAAPPVFVRPDSNASTKNPKSVKSRARVVTHATRRSGDADLVSLEHPSSRRNILISASLAVAALNPKQPAPALAAYGADAGKDTATSTEVTFSTFYGAASPPATYGTLGGTSKDKAKYSYDVPNNWTEEAPTKVEKGAGGQDSRWVLVGGRGATKAYCLTLNRAGEDGAAFGLTDKALNAIAGADAKLQEAVTTGKSTCCAHLSHIRHTLFPAPCGVQGRTPFQSRMYTWPYKTDLFLVQKQ